MLNRVGAEMGEDKSLAPAGSSSGGQPVDALMSSPAYNDPKDPNHARVSEQVRKHFGGSSQRSRQGWKRATDVIRTNAQTRAAFGRLFIWAGNRPAPEPQLLHQTGPV